MISVVAYEKINGTQWFKFDAMQNGEGNDSVSCSV
jgi:hypothetical protein